MPTIHVTIDDPNETLAVVATMLNQGYEVSIDMDRVDLVEPNYMDSAEVEIRERLWGDDKAKLAKLAREQRANLTKHVANFTEHTAFGAKVGFDGSDYFINGVKVSDREFREEMERRARARDERRAESALAQEVACPSCRATKGQACASASGKRYTDFSHIDRIRNWHAVNDPVRADG